MTSDTRNEISPLAVTDLSAVLLTVFGEMLSFMTIAHSVIINTHVTDSAGGTRYSGQPEPTFLGHRYSRLTENNLILSG